MAMIAWLAVLCLVSGVLLYRTLVLPGRLAAMPPAVAVAAVVTAPDVALRAPVMASPGAVTASPELVAPTFDVVRVGPGGRAVIAGRAAAGSEVIVLDGGHEIARATADRRGEFVALPNEALAAGGRELRLTARDAAGTEVRGEQSVVTVVPEIGAGAGAGAPVVALLDARGGSRVLQQADLGAGRRVSLDIVDYDAAGAVRFGGRAEAGVTVRVYVDTGLVGEARADRTGHWALVPGAAISAGVHTLRADAADDAGRVLGRVEMPFQRAALAGGEALAGDGAGRVVVQPGQTLWRIAREAYGSGVRYTVIYTANQGQIRDPRLIYPGQTFAVPVSAGR